MNKLRFLVLGACLLTFSSCIDVVEELFLNKNGSGKYNITIDMSAFMADGMMDMVKGMAQQEEGQEIPDLPSEMDTIIHMKNAPDSIKARFDDPKFLEKVKIHTVMSESQEKMFFKFMLDFEEVSDINYFLANFDKLQDSNTGGQGMPLSSPGGGGLLPGAIEGFDLFDYTKKTLVRNAPPAKASDIPEDEMGMMKMFFSDATYRTIYHLPGKVKKWDITDATLDGKTLTAEYDLINIMEGKAKMEGKIQFKK